MGSVVNFCMLFYFVVMVIKKFPMIDFLAVIWYGLDNKLKENVNVICMYGMYLVLN